MSYVAQFDAGPFDLVVVQSGPASLATMLAGRAELLADPRFRPGMTALIDISGLDVEAMPSDDVRRLADPDPALTAAGFRCLAIVAPQPAAFGLARMFEVHALEAGFAEHVAVVESVDEAVAWLAALDAGAV